MILGALLDLGIDVGIFKRELAGLNLDGFDIAVEKKSNKLNSRNRCECYGKRGM